VSSLGVDEVMVNWNEPLRLPLKFPLKTNEPVSVAAEVKHPVEVVIVRFVPVIMVPLCVKDVVNAKAGVPSVLVKFAVQFPVSVSEAFELPPPHALKTRKINKKNMKPNCFINHS